MKKRALSVILALALLIGILPIQANAYMVLDNGIMYEAYEDHVEIIDFNWAAPLNVIIPAEIEGKPVTVIGDGAFGAGVVFSMSLSGVSLPDTVTRIEDCAFNENYAIATLDLPDNLTYLGYHAFYRCRRLANISLPDKLTYIGRESFKECYALSSIDLPDAITTIEPYTFEDCTHLSSVELSDNLTSISNGAFWGCKNLRRITLPETLSSIGSLAFFDCSNLTSITFCGDAPEFGEEYVFDFVHANAYYPVGNPTWTEDVMQNYSGQITWIPYDPSHPHEFTPSVVAPTCTEHGFTFYTCTCGYGYQDNFVNPLGHDYANNICTRCGEYIGLEYTVHEDHVEITGLEFSSTAVAIPSVIEGKPVTSIGDGAFYKCRDLLYVSLPDSITSIGGGAFLDCTALTSIHFEGDAPYIGDFAFENVNATAYYPEGNPTWTEDVMRKYYGCGTITWVPYSTHTHEYTAVIAAPTCTEQGFTTHTCTCGESYVDNYVDALGHNYVDGFCTRCSEADPDYVKPVENPFSDVPAGSWFEKPVLWAMENGITSGTSANSFSPDDSCLRSHVATFLWAAEGKPEPSSYSTPFTDVREYDWFYSSVLWAVENGITSGVSPTEFGAHNVCSRYQVVFFLWRAAGSPEPVSTQNPFTDVQSTDFFYKAVLWAVENGITSGVSATQFGPYNPCTRAQVVTFLYAAYN